MLEKEQCRYVNAVFEMSFLLFIYLKMFSKSSKDVDQTVRLTDGQKDGRCPCYTHILQLQFNVLQFNRNINKKKKNYICE